MKVAELVKILADLPQDLEVVEMYDSRMSLFAPYQGRPHMGFFVDAKHSLYSRVTVSDERGRMESAFKKVIL